MIQVINCCCFRLLLCNVVMSQDVSAIKFKSTIIRRLLYCTLHVWNKGTKCALFSIKCKGAVQKISFIPQRISEDGNCIFAYHVTLDSNEWSCACILSSSTSRSTLPLVKHFSKA